MRIEPLDLADEETVNACHEVRDAVVQADDACEPPVSTSVFRASLAASWSGAPREVWFVPGETTGTVAAWCRMESPDLANLDRASIELLVRPALRRAGIGTALLRHAADRAAVGGRVTLEGKVQEGSAGEAFARRAGATFGIAAIRRVLDLEKTPAGKFARLRETAAETAAGYSLTRWEGVTPDTLLDQVASLYHAHDDAPRGANIEAHSWDAQRVRDRSDVRLARSGSRRYTVAALHDATKQMAALTEVIVDPGAYGWALQAVTAVTREHRGYRLALLIRADMLDWLSEAEPQLRRMMTWSAESNRHVATVNETLGYRACGRLYRSAELPVVSAISA